MDEGDVDESGGVVVDPPSGWYGALEGTEGDPVLGDECRGS